MPGLQERMEPLLCANLAVMGVPMTTEETARRQNLPIQSAVLANHMPAAAAVATENQFGELLCSNPEVAVNMVLAKYDDDRREGINPQTRETRSRTDILARYTPFSKIRFPVGILIITGDNQEVKPYEGLASRTPIDPDEIWYSGELMKLVRRGEENDGPAVTILSCLGAHLGLNYLHDIPKNTRHKKAFGVYQHEILDDMDPIVKGLGRTVLSPHSRWGEVGIDQIKERNKQLEEKQQLKILAASQEIGWLLLKEALPNGNVRIYVQGHPEYDRDDLKNEWRRDAKTGLALPVNYFPDDDPQETPKDNWAVGAHGLYQNIQREACRISAAQEISEV